jgi:Kef-type K+ transport system membrane component KefB
MISSRLKKGAVMENVWVISTIWIGLALVSALVSIRVGISVALIEIVVGSVGGNLLGLTPNDWISYLASLGAVLLTFLAGAELDPVVVRKHLGSTLSIGLAGFFLPYLGVLAYAHFLLGWDCLRRRSPASLSRPRRSPSSTR